MRLSENIGAVVNTVRRYNISNPRVFGSVARGDDADESDIDLLIDPAPSTTLFDLGGLQEELQELLGCRVDLVTPAALPRELRDRILNEAKPL
ncbi:putative nucleotidyltransferase [Rhizobium paknamense]|uniref:Nucleotidyltransferase n=1 Tax=Rhizobium paknamense TaxID=1206817 RepID=A0ABU0I852_9HYPH|nr:putative nucleotidyltransferase [Rhizobium paknamense]